MTDARGRPWRVAAAWTAAEMADTTKWHYRLSEPEIAELDAAVAGLKARRLSIPDIGRADFPLPTLSAALGEMRREVESGCGVMLLRGLPVLRWGEADSLLAYWGIGTHLGIVTGQNAAGELLGHVRAEEVDWDTDPTVRGYRTSSFLPFHCDKSDIVGLLCLHGAKAGGTSCIASSLAIHNAVLERRPELVDALFSPLYVDVRAEEPPHMRPYYLQPLYSWHGGRLFGRFGRKYVESAQRFADVPRLTDAQIEAMDYVETLAGSDEFRLDMEFRPGDIQLLNNHAIVHSRTSYDDHPEPERRRHLVRMLLFVESYRDVPDYIHHINQLTRWWRDNPRRAAAAQ